MDKNQYVDPFFFTWYRTDKGYIWDEEAKATPLSPDKSEEGPFLRENEETTCYFRYKPFKDEPTLFLKFAGTAADPEALLCFANQHGMLSPGISIVSKRVKKARAAVGIGNLPGLLGEPLSFWDRKLRDMKRLVMLWQWLELEDIEHLSLVIKWQADGAGVSYVLGDEETLRFVGEMGCYNKTMEPLPQGVEPGLIANKYYYPELLERFSTFDVILPARYLLLHKINQELKEHPTKAKVLMNDENEPGFYFVPESLLAAMWFQFLQAITGAKRFKRCMICGRWADVTEKRKVWSRHHECANQERVRRSRAKAKNLATIWPQERPD
jgi:hypothetical protein